MAGSPQGACDGKQETSCRICPIRQAWASARRAPSIWPQHRSSNWSSKALHSLRLALHKVWLLQVLPNKRARRRRWGGLGITQAPQQLLQGGIGVADRLKKAPGVVGHAVQQAGRRPPLPSHLATADPTALSPSTHCSPPEPLACHAPETGRPAARPAWLRAAARRRPALPACDTPPAPETAAHATPPSDHAACLQKGLRHGVGGASTQPACNRGCDTGLEVQAQGDSPRASGGGGRAAAAMMRGAALVCSKGRPYLLILQTWATAAPIPLPR